jgi:hypothetical protein
MRMTKPHPLAETIEARHIAACALDQPVDRSEVSRALKSLAAEIDAPFDIRFVETEAAALKAAYAAALVQTRWTEVHQQATALAFAAPNDNLARTDRLVPALRAARVADRGEAAGRDRRGARMRNANWELPSLAVAAIGAAARGDIMAMRRWLPLLEALEAGCFSFWIDGAAIHAAERPTVLLDHAGRLHSASGPAFVWLADIRSYYWHGVLVPSLVVERPGCITIDIIHAAVNAEIRRVMIERYRCGDTVDGPAAYMRDAGGRPLEHDERYGTLWRCDVPANDPLVMIEVINATAEPDGRFRHHWLRVPPTVTSAREAVAWTFGMEAAEYTPRIET